MNDIAIREMLFSVRSVHDNKHPAEIAMHSDDSGGKPRESCRKYIRSREVHCCGFALRIFLGVHSRGLAMHVLCIPEVGHLIALSSGLSLHTMHFLLSHAVRQLSSHRFLTDVRAGPVFEVHV